MCGADGLIVLCRRKRSGPSERSKRKRKKKKIPPSPLRVIREDWRPAGTIRGLLLLSSSCCVYNVSDAIVFSPLVSLTIFFFFSSFFFPCARVGVCQRVPTRRRARRGEERDSIDMPGEKQIGHRVSSCLPSYKSFLLIKLFIPILLLSWKKVSSTTPTNVMPRDSPTRLSLSWNVLRESLFSVDWKLIWDRFYIRLIKNIEPQSREPRKTEKRVIFCRRYEIWLRKKKKKRKKDLSFSLLSELFGSLKSAEEWICAFLSVSRALRRRSFIFIQGRRRGSQRGKRDCLHGLLGIFLFTLLTYWKMDEWKREMMKIRGTMKDGG